MKNLFFNNKDFIKDFDCYILKGYEINGVEEEIVNEQVEGSELGSLTIKTNSYKDIVRTFDLRMFHEKSWSDKFDDFEDFINNIEDNRLIISDNINKCLRVKYAKISNIKEEYGKVINFSITFTCFPFYFDAIVEKFTWTKGEKLLSNTKIPYKCVFEVVCNGNTRIFINGELLTFNSNGIVVVDCERQYVYKKDTKERVRSSGSLNLEIKKGINTFDSETNNGIDIMLNNRYRR